MSADIEVELFLAGQGAWGSSSDTGVGVGVGAGNRLGRGGGEGEGQEQGRGQGDVLHLRAPCLLPDLDTVKAVHVRPPTAPTSGLTDTDDFTFLPTGPFFPISLYLHSPLEVKNSGATTTTTTTTSSSSTTTTSTRSSSSDNSDHSDNNNNNNSNNNSSNAGGGGRRVSGPEAVPMLMVKRRPDDPDPTLSYPNSPAPVPYKASLLGADPNPNPNSSPQNALLLLLGATGSSLPEVEDLCCRAIEGCGPLVGLVMEGE